MREKETQYLQISKQLSEFYKTVGTLNDSAEGKRLFSGSSNFSRLFTELGQWINTGFAVRLEEPVKIIGDFQGSGNDWNRLQSALREREREIEVLRARILEIEKNSKRSSNNGQENTIALLRQENERLNREITNLKSSSSRGTGNENTIAFLKQ